MMEIQVLPLLLRLKKLKQKRMPKKVAITLMAHTLSGKNCNLEIQKKILTFFFWLSIEIKSDFDGDEAATGAVAARSCPYIATQV